MRRIQNLHSGIVIHPEYYSTVCSGVTNYLFRSNFVTLHSESQTSPHTQRPMCGVRLQAKCMQCVCDLMPQPKNDRLHHMATESGASQTCERKLLVLQQLVCKNHYKHQATRPPKPPRSPQRTQNNSIPNPAGGTFYSGHSGL